MSSFSIFSNFVTFFTSGDSSLFWGSLLSCLLVIMLWSRDMVRESNQGGFHTEEVEKSIKWSMGWFITSEVFFFVAFFWGFFHYSLSSAIESGDTWPPLFVEPLEAFAVPLLNTLILLGSGVSLTWAHHSLIAGEWEESAFGFGLTIFMGLYFMNLQASEYLNCPFSFNDSSYGSIFFLATGFHGFHVFVGTGLLGICFMRLLLNHHYMNHHMNVEAASWYWHFVDAVWLFLFSCIYWWGS